MKKLFLAMVTIIIFVFLSFNYSELYAMFFDKLSKETHNKASEIDFSIDGDLAQEQEINLEEIPEGDEKYEAFIGINFDVKNNSDCDIFIRVAILPVILDKTDQNTVYKLSNSSCEIQYLSENDENNIPNNTYWEKSDDGYYYYKKSMKEGDCLENKLVSGIKLKLNKEEMIDFSDKQMKVVIKVESRQSKYNDYSNAWN